MILLMSDLKIYLTKETNQEVLSGLKALFVEQEYKQIRWLMNPNN